MKDFKKILSQHEILTEASAATMLLNLEKQLINVEKITKNGGALIKTVGKEDPGFQGDVKKINVAIQTAQELLEDLIMEYQMASQYKD